MKTAPRNHTSHQSSPRRDAGSRQSKSDIHQRQHGRGTHVLDYLPLAVIIAAALAVAAAKEIAYGQWSTMAWMQDFMGFFLVLFSIFKFFDLSGFADGFQMYDLLAKSFRPYAYVYPLIEAGLGLSYLARWNLGAVYIVTMVVMLFGSLGVFNALRKDLDLECACMGTILKVPLSTVALIEDLGMAAMAGAMWWLVGSH